MKTIDRVTTTRWQPTPTRDYKGNPLPPEELKPAFDVTIVPVHRAPRYFSASGQRLIRHLQNLRDQGVLVVPPKAKRLQCQVKVEDESEKGFHYQRCYVLRGTDKRDHPTASRPVGREVIYW